jgi:hypothetical protein
MTNIEPEILELAKREYGDNCELARRTEWSYSFKCGPKSYGSISRFMVEKDFEVNASEIRQRWPSMDSRERTDFASNFGQKKTWRDNDTEILEIIMDDGDDHIWSSCALTMLRHSDRSRAVEFLIERLQRCAPEVSPLNYAQALGIAGDRRAAAAIRPYYDKYLKAMEAEAVTGVPDDVFFGPIPYPAFLSIAGALFKIEGSIEYEQVIRKYFNHPNEQVRYWAEHALNVEGPTSKEGLSTRRSVTDSPADLGNWRKTNNTHNTRIGRSLGELSATRKLTHYQNYTRPPTASDS